MRSKRNASADQRPYVDERAVSARVTPGQVELDSHSLGDALAAPSSIRPRVLLGLQRTAGNRAVAVLAASSPKGAGSASGHPTVQRNGPDGETDTSAADAKESPQLDPTSQAELFAAGLFVSNDDRAVLAHDFPDGFTVGHEPTVFVTAVSGHGARSARIEGYRLTQAGPVEAGVEAWIFQVGKGRSILVSSVGGGSVLLDVGSGTSLSPTNPAVRRLTRAVGLVTAGAAAPPSSVLLSHSDADHFNALRPVLELPGFSRTTVQVAREQLRSAAAGQWSSLSLTVDPAQRVVEIDVTGPGSAGARQGDVHVSRRVIDNFELIELRSVPAHERLADPDRRSYNRNRTSPVTIVTDLLTGGRTVYTADAEGRQFTEIVDALGSAAFQRLLGTEGRRLGAIELPHHGGRQAGPDASGLIRMLRLAFESSDGSLRVFTQTSESFASGPSASIRFLEVAGVEVEKVPDDPSRGGEAQTRRLRGSEMSQVTIDVGGVRQVLEIGRANETSVQSAYRKLHEIRQLREHTAALQELVAAGADVPNALRTSVTQLDAELTEVESRVRTRADRVWDRMEAAAGGSEGMRTSRDTSAVTAELGQLATTVRGADTTRIASGVETHVSGLSAHARLYLNAVRMLSALAADQVDELHRLRAEHRELLQAARGILGRAEVAEHVRAAWAASRDHWAGERIQRMAAETATRIVSRRVSAEFRALLAESLARQMQLNELATRAAHGQLSRPPGTGVTPVRTRVGAGVLAAIEIVRIGLDVANQAHEASLAADARAARSARTGMATANWWLRRGVTPTLALTEQSAWSGKYDVVSDDLDQASIQQAAFSDTAPEGTPEFDMVVVEDIERGEILRLVRAWVVALGTLEDWHNANLGPTGPMFEHFSNGWGVRLWSREKKRYSYFHLPELDTDLDRLHDALSESQADVLDLDVLEAGEGAVRTVEDTAWFGVDREMYVYNERGYLEELDFEDDAPRVLVLSAPQNVGLAGRDMTLVKAADMATYRRLSGYWWRRYTGQTSISRSGIHDEYVIEPNSKARAWVRPEEVISNVGTTMHETVVRVRHPELAESVPDR